jgi:molybdopterin-guanine dinucleotide biosynthesis protein A
VKTFDPELLSFFNVNTPEQLEQAKEIIAAESR